VTSYADNIAKVVVFWWGEGGEGRGEYETLKRLRKSRRHKQVLDVQELQSLVCPALRLGWQKNKLSASPRWLTRSQENSLSL
jgi:hypothetical protein